MAYNYEYPYTDPNRYNSDWILDVVKQVDTNNTTVNELLESVQTIKEDVNNAIASQNDTISSAITSQNSKLDNAIASQNDTISSAISSQDSKIDNAIADLSENLVSYEAYAKLYASQSKAYSEQSEEYANQAKTYSENTKEYAEQSADNLEQAITYYDDTVSNVNKILNIATFTVDSDGYLVYSDNGNYTFTIDQSTGNLLYEVA